MVANYDELVAAFEKIDAAQAQQLVQGEDEAIIYIGKAVCPYCQRFVPKLKKVAEETGAHIYHVNSVEKSDMDGITAFRQEYDIPTVPGFIYSKGGSVKVKCDSSMSEEDIKAFMHK